MKQRQKEYREKVESDHPVIWCRSVFNIRENQSKPWSPGKTAFGQLLVLARCAQCPVVFAQTVWILLSSAPILEESFQTL